MSLFRVKPRESPVQRSFDAFIRAEPTKMKIAVLQFNPVKGDVKNNLTRAEKILLKGTGDMDILVLPEMAFTGRPVC